MIGTATARVDDHLQNKKVIVHVHIIRDECNENINPHFKPHRQVGTEVWQWLRATIYSMNGNMLLETRGKKKRGLS
jgi:hypothetical protein